MRNFKLTQVTSNAGRIFVVMPSLKSSDPVFLDFDMMVWLLYIQ